MRPDRWAVALDCGHEARIPGLPPRLGAYISCQAAGCRRQERVTAVRAVPVVYVQEALL